MPDRQSTNDNNPFAPPPEGQPDQPWQPRRPQRPDGQRGRDDHASDGSGEGSGDPSSPVTGSADGRWSPRQPGRSSDGFGGGPERRGGQGGGPAGPGPERPGLRWDPTDPAQRRARYAVLGGMWAFFFAIFDLPQLALLLGALSVYWAVSALRSKPKEPQTPEAAAGMSRESQPPSQPSGRPAAPSPARSMRTAAIGGLVSATVALLIVGFGFTMQLVYRDFYECRDDALTHAGELACNDLLPKPLRTGFGVRE
ncbi:hypothetical protein [Streptomyces termitum]|uniref:hypothetical protein n=1 Tax=Streptomyces termitum TaxID=67368 RepID=UPI0033A4814B